MPRPRSQTEHRKKEKREKIKKRDEKNKKEQKKKNQATKETKEMGKLWLAFTSVSNRISRMTACYTLHAG